MPALSGPFAARLTIEDDSDLLSPAHASANPGFLPAVFSRANASFLIRESFLSIPPGEETCAGAQGRPWPFLPDAPFVFAPQSDQAGVPKRARGCAPGNANPAR